jgi:UPF0716 family protein affecting phage T7 exclusion
MFDFLDQLWIEISSGKLTAVVGAIATIASATLGALVVISQNAKQARRATEQVRQGGTLSPEAIAR